MLDFAMQLHANTLRHLQPHCIWSLPAPCLTHFTEHQQQHPLQLQWDLLTNALGYEAVIDPHVAVALLLSAASVGCTPSHSQKQQQPVHQVWLSDWSPLMPSCQWLAGHQWPVGAKQCLVACDAIALLMA